MNWIELTAIIGSNFTFLVFFYKIIDKRFDGVDKKFEKIDQRFEKIDQRFNSIEQRLSRIEGQLMPHFWSPKIKGEDE